MGWIEIIHKCKTPDLQEIEGQEVQVGSIWECDGAVGARNNGGRVCRDRWKLRQIKGEGRGNVGNFPKWDRLTVNGEELSLAQTLFAPGAK